MAHSVSRRAGLPLYLFVIILFVHHDGASTPNTPASSWCLRRLAVPSGRHGPWSVSVWYSKIGPTAARGKRFSRSRLSPVSLTLTDYALQLIERVVDFLTFSTTEIFTDFDRQRELCALCRGAPNRVWREIAQRRLFAAVVIKNIGRASLLLDVITAEPRLGARIISLTWNNGNDLGRTDICADIIRRSPSLRQVSLGSTLLHKSRKPDLCAVLGASGMQIVSFQWTGTFGGLAAVAGLFDRIGGWPALRHLTLVSTDPILFRSFPGVKWKPFRCTLQSLRLRGFAMWEPAFFESVLASSWACLSSIDLDEIHFDHQDLARTLRRHNPPLTSLRITFSRTSPSGSDSIEAFACLPNVRRLCLSGVQDGCIDNLFDRLDEGGTRLWVLELVGRGCHSQCGLLGALQARQTALSELKELVLFDAHFSETRDIAHEAGKLGIVMRLESLSRSNLRF